MVIDMKKIIFTIFLIIVISITVIFLRFSNASPCKRLDEVFKNPASLIMILDKLTFFIEKPTYLSKFESVVEFPFLPVRDFDQISLGIDWESLNIISTPSNFRFYYDKNASLKSMKLDYRNISADHVKIIAFGFGARARLVFSLRDGKQLNNYKNWSAEEKLENFSITLECD